MENKKIDRERGKRLTIDDRRSTTMKHQPVLVEEVIEALNIKEGGMYLDGTVGYGGHAEAILKAGKGSLKYIGLDRDKAALETTEGRLKKYKNVVLLHASYNDVLSVAEEEDIELLDGILLDLGASSPQFDEAQRGFSFQKDGPLDMRFDVSRGITAAEVLNTYQKDKLAKILREYGEEKYAGKIAASVEMYRKKKQFKATSELKTLIEHVIPRRFWQKNIHPATRTFQALRIEVNNELGELEEALPKLISMLAPGGRIAVISFHSLEDRIVKRAFKLAAKECVCPKEFPVCRCDKKITARIITKKPIRPTKTEIKNNVRSRSAKLRVAERV